MVMNIGTGGGTLLHEMVHAMAEADWPRIPAWLNEGLGSLFEAADRDGSGRAIGITNWRLPGLQQALLAGKAPRLDELLRMTDAQFYDEARSGVNYAAVRYLMQYLQQQRKLESFYARVRDGNDADAVASLLAVFDNKLTLDQIEQSWREWVKQLRFARPTP